MVSIFIVAALIWLFAEAQSVSERVVEIRVTILSPTGSGLFVNVAHAYFDAYGGADRDWLHYGLPIEEAARMGDTFLRYEIVRKTFEEADAVNLKISTVPSAGICKCAKQPMVCPSLVAKP